MDKFETLRNEVREFARQYVLPRATDIDLANDFPSDLWLQLGNAGLLGMTIPKKYGGRGLGYAEHLIAMEELSRASASVGLSYAAQSNICMDNLCRNGNESQLKKYLPAMCRGELIGGLAMSEPEAGSDVVGSMQCRAELKDNTWIANGTKKWITNGPEADMLIVYMRSGNKKDPSHSLTAFLVDTDLKGFSRSPRTDKLGMRGSNTCQLFLENVQLSQESVLGTVNNGAALLMAGLDSERLILSGGPIGIMQAVLDICLPFVRQRKQFGRAIGSFELIQSKLADIYTHLQAARAYAYRIADNFDGTRQWSKDTSACYLFASQAAVQAALESIQILGARGYMNESTTSRLLRDAKLYDIGGGTNEIRRIIIGKALFEENPASAELQQQAS